MRLNTTESSNSAKLDEILAKYATLEAEHEMLQGHLTEYRKDLSKVEKELKSQALNFDNALAEKDKQIE